VCVRGSALGHHLQTAGSKYSARAAVRKGFQDAPNRK
jgi:hypothetical protein